MSAHQAEADPFAAVRVRLHGRAIRNALMNIVLGVVMIAVLSILAWVIVYVGIQGVAHLGPDFLTHNPPGNPGMQGGGFYNGIIGSLIVVGLAGAIAVPLGLSSAVYLVEFGRGRFAAGVRFFNDVLIGVPTIVTGAFVYTIWVIHFGFSGIAGAIALAVVMLPLVTRASEEMLLLVPNDYREASLALGATRARTVRSVIIPTALPGITTGVMLALARAMGETAPLLLTALGNDLFTEANPTHRMSTLSLQIFGNATTGFRAAQGRAWAGALTLVAIVLLLTALARYFATRSTMAAR